MSTFIRDVSWSEFNAMFRRDDGTSGLELLEEDQIVVKRSFLDAARKGDESAVSKLRELIDNTTLYMHLFTVEKDEVIVDVNLLRRALGGD